MSVLAPNDIRALLSPENKPWVSIYMPTHRRGREVEQDPIRFKNLLKLASQRLADYGMKANEAEELLAPAAQLLEDILFWKHQSDGLAVFVAPGVFRHHRLAVDFDEVVVVGDRGYIKPLIPVISGDGHFYLLAFSKKEVRLLQGTKFSIAEIALEGLPRSLEEYLNPEKLEKHLQFHTGAPGRSTGKRDAMYFGSADPDSDMKKNLLGFFRELDKGLRDLFKEDRAPLVLAGVEYLFPIYRDASKYAYLAESGVTGNPDDATTEELHGKAWKIVQPVFEQHQTKAWERWQQMAGTDSKQASADLPEIVKAAHTGRVETLFVGKKMYCWGSYNAESGEVKVHEREKIGLFDLLDFAVAHTLSTGGQVFSIDQDKLPAGTPMTAVLRY